VSLRAEEVKHLAWHCDRGLTLAFSRPAEIMVLNLFLTSQEAAVFDWVY
jgi:hypothetical protein